ncbi:uncharacterized protein METZ01_LOCUS115483 [marine metagenome]|uniref:Uncharacterized protein n=1 Tax=marine metagenome TaxID=408172 RepID=A0A381XD16_9ZZZZ
MTTFHAKLGYIISEFDNFEIDYAIC